MKAFRFLFLSGTDYYGLVGRAHAILSTFLPNNLLPSLEPPSSRTAFLAPLSSGQLLCVAYNTCVRKSKQPWGYVNKDDIHDIIALEKAEADTVEGGKKGWTFRRIDNLRLWAGSVRILSSFVMQLIRQQRIEVALHAPNTGIDSASCCGCWNDISCPAHTTCPFN